MSELHESTLMLSRMPKSKTLEISPRGDKWRYYMIFYSMILYDIIWYYDINQNVVWVPRARLCQSGLAMERAHGARGSQSLSPSRRQQKNTKKMKVGANSNHLKCWAGNTRQSTILKGWGWRTSGGSLLGHNAKNVPSRRTRNRESTRIHFISLQNV
jgi:hypothetical protein